MTTREITCTSDYLDVLPTVVKKGGVVYIQGYFHIKKQINSGVITKILTGLPNPIGKQIIHSVGGLGTAEISEGSLRAWYPSANITVGTGGYFNISYLVAD